MVAKINVDGGRVEVGFKREKEKGFLNLFELHFFPKVVMSPTWFKMRTNNEKM